MQIIVENEDTQTYGPNSIELRHGKKVLSLSPNHTYLRGD